jgi:surface antigen
MIGKLRNLTTRTLAVRATGALAAGAVLAGAGATAAQAAVPSPGKDVPHGPVSIAGATKGDAHRVAAPKDAPDAPKSVHAPTAQDAVHLAESQVGQHEKGGATKFSKWYMSTDRAKQTVKRDGGSIGAYKDASWCSMFVSWVGNKLDFSHQMGDDAWTVQHAKWFEAQHRFGHTPKPGAVVFYSWDGGKSVDDIEHVGMVVKSNPDGTIKTVEGNTGNAVKVKVRPTDNVVGYGYPQYAK